METNEQLCQLCEKNTSKVKMKNLYDTLICNSCHSEFANKRQMAFVIDIVAFKIATIPFSTALVMGGFDSIVAAYMLIPIFLLKDGINGQSLGKKIFGIQIIDKVTGKGIGMKQSFLRNLPLAIPLFPIFVAFQLKDGFRTGDGIGKSKAIWKKYSDRQLFNIQ